MDKQYIDRQAVINLLYNVYSREVYTHEGTVQKVTGEIDINELSSIPAANVRENVKGKWEVSDATTTWLDGHYYCSQCGARSEWGGYFCPNCGADMGEKK